MVAWPLLAVAVPILGASGTVAGVLAALAVEVALVPTAFTAAILNVYDVPFVRPVKTRFSVADPTLLVVAPVTPVAAETPSLAKTATR
jgi:membrane associated rhomboid family serine protease